MAYRVEPGMEITRLRVDPFEAAEPMFSDLARRIRFAYYQSRFPVLWVRLRNRHVVHYIRGYRSWDSGSFNGAGPQVIS